MVLFTGLFVMAALFFGPEPPQKLWPNGAPGQKANQAAEANTTTPNDGTPGGRPVVRLSNVLDPTITAYPAPKSQRRTDAAVLVFPGGGYRILAYDLEGTEICEWLNSIGVTAFLVKYRVPQPAEVPRYQAPLQDAERAMGWVRSHATQYSISPEKIGVLGFSAGGHLLATLSRTKQGRTYPVLDQADHLSARPDFTMLVYPAYLSTEDAGFAVAPEVMPNSTLPPVFIVQAEDDGRFIAGTLLYYRALHDAHVPAELHVYSHGGHGYGLRHTDRPVTDWPQLAEGWIKRVLSSEEKTLR